MKKHFYTNYGKTLAQTVSNLVKRYEKRIAQGENPDDIRSLLSESLSYWGEMQPFEYRSL